MFIKKILKNDFFKESIIYGLSGALSKFAVFLTIPIYTRYLSLEDFGILDLYLTMSALIYIFFEMQIQTGFMRSYYERKKEHNLAILLGSVFSFYLIGYIFLLITIFILFIFSPDSEYMKYQYLLPISLTVILKQIFDINNIIMRMEHKSKIYLIFNISNIFLIATFGIFTVIYISSTIEGILWSIFFGNLILAIFAFFNIYNNIKIKLNFKFFKEVFYYGAPIVPAVLGGWAMSAIGKIYITEYLPLYNLGIYSLALKVSMIFLLFVQAFRMSWQPFMIKKFNEKDAHKIFARALDYYLIIGFMMVCIIYILSPFIIDILAPKKYDINHNMILILLFSYFWQGAINIIAAGNSWVRKTYYNSVGSIVGSLIVLMVTYYLIQEIGILGVAIGQLIGFICSFFITIYFAQKNIKINYSIGYIVLMLFMSFGIILV